MKIKEIYARIVGIIIIGLIFPFLARTEGTYIIGVFFSTIYTTISWSGCVFIFKTLSKKYPHYEQNFKRISYEIICVTLFIVLIDLVLGYTIDVYLIGHDFSLDRQWRITILALIFSYAIIAVYESIYFFDLLTHKIRETEQLKNENLQSQFDVLRNQVNPHFLFNSLNTLMTIIPEDTSLALEFTEKLAAVYRYILQHKDKEVVTLKTELEFIEDFYFLQKTRFGDNLKINYKIAEVYQQQFLPPLSLQMLIENAIKHNIISTEKPLSIEIYVENNKSLVVKNNLQKKITNIQSTQIGLQNISNRYKYLSHQMVDVITTSTSFMVALPLLELNPDTRL